MVFFDLGDWTYGLRGMLKVGMVPNFPGSPSLALGTSEMLLFIGVSSELASVEIY